MVQSGSLLVSLNNLAAVTDKSAWAGAVGFRKAIMKSQWSPRRVCSVLRREVPQVADSPTVGLATDLETALSSCGLSYNAIWPWSCHQHHIPKDPGVVTPACASGVRPADVGTNYGLRSGQWPSSSPSAVARKPRGKLTRQSDQRSWNSPITSHSKTHYLGETLNSFIVVSSQCICRSKSCTSNTCNFCQLYLNKSGREKKT